MHALDFPAKSFDLVLLMHALTYSEKPATVVAEGARVFDTALADFNYPQLFSENRFTGGDRFGDANQLTARDHLALSEANGQEALRATIGQRYYFRDERVGLTPTSPLRTSNESDILASVGGRLFRYWTFDITTQYNPLRAARPSAYGSLRYRPSSPRWSTRATASAASPAPDRPVGPVADRARGWYGVGRYNYSFLDDRLLEGLAGVEYNAGCWVFRAVVHGSRRRRRWRDRAVFQLEFNGVGQIGTDDAVSFCRGTCPATR